MFGRALVIVLLISCVRSEKINLKCSENREFDFDGSGYKDECDQRRTCFISNIVADKNSEFETDEIINEEYPKFDCLIFENSTLYQVPEIASKISRFIVARNSSVYQPFTRQPETANVGHDFSHNEITEVSLILGGTPCFVNYSHNKIRTVNLNMVYNGNCLYRKNYLIFSHNQISNFSLEISEVSKMYGWQSPYKLLDLSHNKLTEIPEAIVHTKDMQVTDVNLSHNNIKKVTLKKPPNEIIEKLDLSNNQIEEICLDDFVEFKRLKQLSLAHNKISKIVVKDDPKQYGNLESLDLSNNLLKIFSFVDLPYNSLGKLDVSHNQIKDVFGPDLDASERELIRIDFLSIGSNQITDYTPIFYMKDLKTLDLSGSSITNFPFVRKSKITNLILKDNEIKLKYGIFPRDIEMLDLTRNKLGDTIDENQFIFYHKLETVILNENGISKNFLTRDFQAAKIKKLGISGNEFWCKELAELIKILNISDTQSIDDNKTVEEDSNINGFGCREA
jgi:Leucine-rich repeat (LRR) protein